MTYHITITETDLAKELGLPKAELDQRLQALSSRSGSLSNEDLLQRITSNPQIFGGKPIIRGHRLAVEHVLGMLAAGDSPELIQQGYPWMEREDVLACIEYARRVVGQERIELRD